MLLGHKPHSISYCPTSYIEGKALIPFWDQLVEINIVLWSHFLHSLLVIVEWGLTARPPVVSANSFCLGRHLALCTDVLCSVHPVLYIFTKACYCLFLIIAILLGVKSYLIWFWFALPWWLITLSIFHIIIHHLYIFFGELSIQTHCPFFNWVIFLLLDCNSFLHILDASSLSNILFAKTSSYSVVCL